MPYDEKIWKNIVERGRP